LGDLSIFLIAARKKTIRVTELPKVRLAPCPATVQSFRCADAMGR
jgi:hypothetical protein